MTVYIQALKKRIPQRLEESDKSDSASEINSKLSDMT